MDEDDNVLDMVTFQRRKHLEENMKDLKGMAFALKKAILELSKYKKYRSINIKLNELQALYEDINSVYKKRVEQLKGLDNGL